MWTFMRWAWDMLNVPFVDSSTVKWDISTRGISARVVGSGGGSTPATPSGLVQFVVLDVSANDLSDNITCYKQGDLKKTPVLVDKNPKLRGSITSAVIDGVTWSYSYPSGFYKRTASTPINGTVYNEKEVISPRFLTGDLIYAMSYGGGYIDMNLDARAWVKSANQG